MKDRQTQLLHEVSRRGRALLQPLVHVLDVLLPLVAGRPHQLGEDITDLAAAGAEVQGGLAPANVLRRVAASVIALEDCLRDDLQVFPAALRAMKSAAWVNLYREQMSPAAQQMHAVAQQRVLHDLGRLRVFAGQDAVARFDQKHFGAEPGKGLCHFAPDRARADHTDSFRQFGQREDRLVGQVLDFVEPRDGRNG